jgi:hypothetical protein
MFSLTFATQGTEQSSAPADAFYNRLKTRFFLTQDL